MCKLFSTMRCSKATRYLLFALHPTYIVLCMVIGKREFPDESKNIAYHHCNLVNQVTDYVRFLGFCHTYFFSQRFKWLITPQALYHGEILEEYKNCKKVSHAWHASRLADQMTDVLTIFSTFHNSLLFCC